MSSAECSGGLPLPSQLVFTFIASAAYLHPFGLSAAGSAMIGLVVGILVILLGIRLEKASLERLIGAACGAILGTMGALLIGHPLSLTTTEIAASSFLPVTVQLTMPCLGLVLGANKSDLLDLGALLAGLMRLWKNRVTG